MFYLWERAENMRTIRVRNASIFANLNGREIDFEMRTTKDSAQGFALLVDNVTWLEIDATESGTLCDSKLAPNSPREPLLKLKMIKSNGCLGKGEIELMMRNP